MNICVGFQPPVVNKLSGWALSPYSSDISPGYCKIQRSEDGFKFVVMVFYKFSPIKGSIVHASFLTVQMIGGTVTEGQSQPPSNLQELRI